VVGFEVIAVRNIGSSSRLIGKVNQEGQRIG